MIKLLINNIEADYKEVSNLGFNITASIKDFLSIGSVSSFELDNAANTLVLPASKLNKTILINNQNIPLSFKLFKDSIQVFSGECIYKTANYFNDYIDSFNLDVYGGNGQFLQDLEGVSLRDLQTELGTETYDQTTIEATWAGTPSTHKGIFAPIIYGLLDGTPSEWKVEDFRFHVYFDSILQAIADYLNITISSTFRTTDLWKRCIYAFGVGKNWKSDTQSSLTETLEFNDTTETITIVTASTYTISFYLNTGGDVDLNHVEITTSTGFTSIQYDKTLYTQTETVVTSIELSASDTITINGYNSRGTILKNMGSGTYIKAFGSYDVLEGKDFYISSCLHDLPIKSLLKQWVLMFNWAMHFNHITKVLTIEPLFDYKIGSTTYRGFYNLTTESYNELDEDVSQYSINYYPIYDKLRFSYKDNREYDKLIEANINSDLPVLGTETEIGNGTNLKTFGDVFFKRCYNGTFEGVNNTGANLPIILDENYNINLNDGNTAERPSFLSDPICLFVSSSNASLTFEGSTENIPVLMQNNINTSDHFTLSWSDVTVEGSTVKEGLVTTFYNRYFAFLRRLEVMKIKVKIKDIIHINTFNKAYKRGNEFYILTRLDNVKLDNILYDATLIRYVNELNTDAAKTTHNDLIPSQSYIQLEN